MRALIAPVPNDLEPANHLADSEETKYFRGHDTKSSKGGRVEVPYLAEERFRVFGCFGRLFRGGGRGLVHQSRRIADGTLDLC